MLEDRQPRNNFSCCSIQVMKQYGTYTASPAKKTTLTIREVTIDKSLQFHINWFNISRDTIIKARPKIHPKILNFYSFHNPDPTMIV